MNETMLKPGYKQTDIGVLPEEWEVSILGELTFKVGSGITPTGGNKVYQNSGRPFVRSQNVGWGTLLLDDIAYISEEIHSAFISSEIKERDVLLNITGASIGRSAMADSRIINGNVNQHVCIIRPNEKLLNPSYLCSFLLSANGQNLIDSFQTGGNRQGLNFEQIKSFVIPLPPLAEQQAIADTLGAVDALLREQRALLAKKRDLKLATQTALLTRARRLPGFTGEWQERTLGELAEIVSGGTPSTANSHYWNGEIKWCTPTDITACESKYLFDTEKSITPLGLNSSSTSLLPIGTLLLCSRATVGEIRIAGAKMSTNQGFKALICKPQVNNEFLYYHLLENKQLLIDRAYGSTFLEISKKDTAVVVLEMPTLAEQKAIAQLLVKMDEELELVAAQVAKTEALKQGLMQDLLTGTIRLRGVPLSPTPR